MPGGCACRGTGVYLWGVYLPREGVYLPRVYLSGGVPAQGVGGVPDWGCVYPSMH